MTYKQVPYQQLQICGNFLFAAQMGSIHSFELGESQATICSTWKYPSPGEAASSADKNEAERKLPPHGEGKESPSPAKRRKVQVLDEPVDGPDAAGDGDKAVPVRGRARDEAMPHTRPFVSILKAAGECLVAVTSHDKSVWVFEVGGGGVLSVLSQRIMPKRPSALDMDGTTLIVADKFGDVYSLPLQVSPASTPPPPVDEAATAPSATDSPSTTSTPAAAATSAVSTSTFMPEATELTVHSQRNRRALATQLKEAALRRERGEGQSQVRSERPKFEHALLLGHVSMLTALVVASSAPPEIDGGGGGGETNRRRRRRRRYIITADRDEHVRVSRSVPQAHVVEAFCHGHGQFVSRLAVVRVPSAAGPKPLPDGDDGTVDVLVSGGGDDELFVWDFAAGRLRQRVDLRGPLRLLREGGVRRRSSRTAVDGLHGVGGGGFVATLEGIPALFFFARDDAALGHGAPFEHAQTIALPGLPAHVTVFPRRAGTPTRVAVSVDAVTWIPVAVEGGDASAPEPQPPTSSIRVYRQHVNGGAWAEDESFSFVYPAAGEEDNDAASFDPDMLYTVESLRKQDDEEAQ